MFPTSTRAASAPIIRCRAIRALPPRPACLDARSRAADDSPMIAPVACGGNAGPPLGACRPAAPARPGSPGLLALMAVVFAGLALLATAAAAGARPRCFGHKATIVGNHRANHIKGTPHADVIVGLGGSDTIIGNGGRDVICGGAGTIDRRRQPPTPAQARQATTLIGGPGKDHIDGSFADDFIVGDNANLSGTRSVTSARTSSRASSETTTSSATTTRT